MLGLECSRLARDSADWQQLVKICAHADTLILDEDGLYDPAIFNDRVLLGMKGQISEFELHFLRARMRGGILAKARRGELALALPAGLVRDHHGQVTLDPDAGVRDAVRLLFGTFTATGSAFGVVRAFREQQLTFPARHHRGPRSGELFFQPLTHDRVLTILHNPAYAGAYAYGRASHATGLDGHHHTTARPVPEWTVLIKDHHPGYLTWAQYEANLAVLAANAAARGDDRAAGPPREGTALLQGLVVCGRCGRRMTIRYHTPARHPDPQLRLPERRHPHRAADLPAPGRGHHRRRRQRPHPRRPHPRGHRGLSRRQRRADRPGRTRRPAPPRARPARRTGRRRRPAPLPRRRRRQPARR